MSEQIKSRKRVVDHGEVFTSDREVKAMCDLVSNECLRIDSRFLEPACGDGNFLAEILSRKLEITIKRYKRSAYDYEKNALLALGSLYGVELLQDNVEVCRERLYKLWVDFYKKTVKKKDQNDEILESAKYILSKNIICGNALSFRCVDENGIDTNVPIIFSQWAFATGPNIKREDYVFEKLLNKGDEFTEMTGVQGNIDFEDSSNEEGTLVKIYPPIHYRRLKDYE